MQRRKLHLYAMCFGQGTGQFLERDVRFSLHDLQQKIPVLREFAELAGRAALRLGYSRAVFTMLRCQSHRRGCTHTEQPPCGTGRVALSDVGANPFPKVQRIRFGHDPPPNRSESDKGGPMNPNSIQIKRKPL